MRVRRVFWVGLCGLLVASAVFAGSSPVAVSPGDASKLVLIADACPTFSWGQVEGAQSYELVVYQVGEESEAAKAVLRLGIPGTANVWTPSLDRCLQRGGRYAWSVRTVGEEAASAWSAPSLFQVTAGPSQADFETALRVVRAYLDSGRGAESATSVIAEAQAEPESGAEVSLSSPIPAAPAATQMSVDGNIDATSFSGRGALLTALDPANLSAGTAGIDISGTAATASDLVAAAGCVSESELTFDPATEAEMTAHAGSADAHREHASLEESAEIDADIVDHSTLSNAHHIPPSSLPPSGAAGGGLTGSYPNPQVAPNAVSSVHVLDNSLTGADLGPDSVGSSEIATGAVGTNEVLDGTLTANDLGANSVGSSEVANGSLTSADLASNSVWASEIGTGAVGASEMQGSFCLVRMGLSSCPPGYGYYYIRWDTEDLSNDDACGTPAASCSGSTIAMYFCCK